MVKDETFSVENDSSVLSYSRLVRTADALFSHVSVGLTKYNISPTQFATLKALKVYGPLSQRDIGRYILKTGGNVTVIVDQLEALGFASRLRDSEDRRVCFVNLTNKGEQFFDSIYPPHLERIRATMNKLTDSEQRQLTDLLSKLWSVEEFHPCLDPHSISRK